MANPLKIKYSGSTFNGLQTMTNENMDYAVHTILTEFVANTGPGILTTGSGTSIGSFVDTRRTESVGQTTPGGATSTVSTTTVTQNQSTDSDETEMARPLEYISTSVPIQEQTDTTLNAAIIARALSNLVANGIGSYVMQPSAPNSQYTSILTLTDTVTGNGTASNTTTQIWRRTTGDTAPTTIYPIKLGSQHGTISEMANSDIINLISRFRNQMMTTGIGKYVLQENAPASGTWLRQGAAFTDRRHVFGDDKTYSKAYVKTYSADYSKDYNKDYTKTWDKEYSGSYEKAYTKLYGNEYEKIWSRRS